MAEPRKKRRICYSFEDCQKELSKHVLTCVDSSLFDYANLAILKISECNASQKYSFTEVKCDEVLMAEDDDVPLLFKFSDIFSKGIQLLTDMKNNKRILEDHEKTAVMILASYFRDLEQHEQSLKKVISVVDQEKKEKKSCETELTIAFAEHLLGKLAPGKLYTVDSHMRTKGKCKCGFDHCKGEPNFGGTGIGDVNAWHGFIDIVSSSHPGLPESVGVAVSTLEDDKEETDDDEEETDYFNGSPGGKEFDGTENQAVAQTIVFSFIQRKRHPTIQSLIPNIMISSSNFRIIMYDSVQDILLCTAPIPIFPTNEKKKLITASVIILWIVLHYRMFCVGIKTDVINNLDNIKLNFRNLAKDKYDLYLNLSEVGIRFFPSVSNKFYPSRDSIFGGRPLAQN